MSDRRSMHPDWDGRMRGQMLGGVDHGAFDAAARGDLRPIVEALQGIEQLLAIFVAHTTGKNITPLAWIHRRWTYGSEADYLTPEQAKAHLDAWARETGGGEQQ
jgi:hypothetical protein